VFSLSDATDAHIHLRGQLLSRHVATRSGKRLYARNGSLELIGKDNWRWKTDMEVGEGKDILKHGKRVHIHDRIPVQHCRCAGAGRAELESALGLPMPEADWEACSHFRVLAGSLR
jgi:hypothetical protein